VRPAAHLTILTLLAASVGCIPSHPVAEGELGRYWAIRSAVPPAPASRPSTGEAVGFPTQWHIRQQKSVIWSTVSLVRAADRIREGAEKIDLAVSPAHTRVLVDLLGEARKTMAGLREIAGPAGPPNREMWAEKLAWALANVEQIARLASPDPAGQAEATDAEAGGLAAEPLLQMVSAYLNDSAGGSLLGPLSTVEAATLREVLTQTVLRLGFAAAGKQEGGDLRGRIVETMRENPNPAELESALRPILLAELDRASPAPSGGRLSGIVQAVLSWGPKAIGALEAVLGQWDRVESVTVDFTPGADAPAVVVTVRVLPGEEVRLGDLIILQPTIVLRGASTIVVRSNIAGAGETAVLFEPIGDGAVELRFEGILYGLVRLLAVPLANAALREVRVQVAEGREGEGRAWSISPCSWRPPAGGAIRDGCWSSRTSAESGSCARPSAPAPSPSGPNRPSATSPPPDATPTAA